MALREARQRIIQNLRDGKYRHEERDDVGNALEDGEISIEEIINLLMSCRGNQYKTSPHHSLSLPCNVHIFTPQGWYIKAFFTSDARRLEEGEADTVFISIHK